MLLQFKLAYWPIGQSNMHSTLDLTECLLIFCHFKSFFFHHHNLIGGFAKTDFSVKSSWEINLITKFPEGHNVPYCPEIYTVFVAVKIEQFNSAAAK